MNRREALVLCAGSVLLGLAMSAWGIEGIGSAVVVGVGGGLVLGVAARRGR